MKAIDHPKLQSLLASYRPSDRVKEVVKTTRILLLVGPSGVGKDYVMARLLKSGKFYHLVSHTTRAPRANDGVMEKNGREYNFIDLSAAIRMIEAGEFVEVKYYSGNLYGTTVSEIQKARQQGKVAITDLEIQGVAEYKKINPDVVAVFLLPHDFAIWQQRTRHRHGETLDQADYRLRMETALNELETMLKTDYYIPIVNQDIHQTLSRIQQIVDSPQSGQTDSEAARQTAQELVEGIKQYLDKVN